MPHFAHGARIGPEMGLKGRHVALALAGGRFGGGCRFLRGDPVSRLYRGRAQFGKRRRMVHPHTI